MNTSATVTLKSTPIISSREHEVLQMIALEYSTKEIAQNLYIAYETVHSHRKNLLRKLKASNTAGLMRRGFELGLLKLEYNQIV